MKPPGSKTEWFKSGPWGNAEIFYLVNHVPVLTQKLGSFQKAAEEISRRLGRKKEEIIQKYGREQHKSHHRAG